MEFEIVWSKKSLSTFNNRLEYLEIHFSDKIILEFVSQVSKTLNTIKNSPLIFRKSNLLKDFYKGLIIKQVSVIYRIKEKSNTIELIAFIDNRQKTIKRNF